MPQARTQTPFSAKLKNPPPKKLKNETYRTREFLTEQEINQLRTAARRHGRHGHRDDTLILMMFRHGLRVSEVITLRWEQVDLKQGLLHVRRLKQGIRPPIHYEVFSSGPCGSCSGTTRKLHTYLSVNAKLR